MCDTYASSCAQWAVSALKSLWAAASCARKAATSWALADRRVSCDDLLLARCFNLLTRSWYGLLTLLRSWTNGVFWTKSARWGGSLP